MLTFTAGQILVIGDVILDQYVETNVTRISPEAPVPIAKIERRWSVPGGAANVARNLANLGCRVTIAGVRSHDIPGESLHNLLTKQGISCRWIFTNDRPTPSKLRVISLGHQLLRLDNEDNSDLSPILLKKFWESIKKILGNMKVVIISDYDKGLFRKYQSEISLAQKIILMCKKNTYSCYS